MIATLTIGTVLFYVFAAVTLGAALAVVTLRNPVHSVLSLIAAFFGAFGLCVLLGAEFVAYALVIVYIGAVAILFLFVVMMLNINVTTLKQGFTRYLPFALLIGVVLLFDFFVVISRISEGMREVVKPEMQTMQYLTNTEQLGMVLYTDYILPFQLSGVILLVAMVGCIVLTLRERAGVKKQRVTRQLMRTRTEGVTLVKVASREGVTVLPDEKQKASS